MAAWTGKPPTENGFYWLAQPGEPPQVVEVYVSPDSRVPVCYFVTGRDDDRDAADVAFGTRWCGPLSVPGPAGVG